MDMLGMRAIAKSMRALGHEPPPEELLHPISLGGDILSNSLYYSLIGLGGSRNAWLCGALLGLAAGVGAVALPKRLGLSDEPAARTNTTKALTVSWYLLGGLAAAAAYHLMSNDDR